MADPLDSSGGKRKFHENPLTAKAETGSLKIKIMRKGELQAGAGALPPTGLEGAAYSAPRSPVHAPPPQVHSPPKPRPNRKHVPIFYQRPNAFDISATSSSTDENYTQVSSTSTDYDPVANHSTTSTTSTSGRFARLDLSRENSSSGGILGDLLPPMSNPLFSRGNSETGGMLTDLLKQFPPTLSAENSYEYSETSSLSTQDSTTSMSHTSLLNPAAALRQLASSSAVFSMQSRDTSYSHVLAPPVPSEPLEQVQIQQQEQSKPYQFDPMSALQDAVKMAVATSSPSNSSSTFGRGQAAADHDDGDLGPPPSGPPAFAVEHSLMGGGIEAQPNIASVNTVNFDWTRHQRQAALNRPRAGSLANVSEDGESTQKSLAASNHI